jgi:transcriptional regulator with XRE-family HTH domain
MKELIKLIQRVMKEKDISVLQIQKRSGNNIKESYIYDILNGKTKTMSVEKIHALAQGLGENSVDVFKAASGEEVSFEHPEPWPPHTLLKTMEEVVDDPELTEIVKALVQAKPKKRKDILAQLKKR